jgi:DNA-binding MarR family transcriptional regulator
MDTITTPKGCTNFRLRSMSRLVSRHYDAYLASSGLKVTQYSLLSHLARLSPIRPVDLARKMGLDASTLTRNVKPLMLAGFVAQGDGADARSRLITITDAGRAKHAEAQVQWTRAQNSLNELLGVDRVVALHALLDDTMDVLKNAGLTEDSTD